MVIAAHGERHQGVKPSELVELRCIDVDTTSKTIGIISQRSEGTDTPKLSRNYGINNRILRYKYLKH